MAKISGSSGYITLDELFISDKLKSPMPDDLWPDNLLQWSNAYEDTFLKIKDGEYNTAYSNTISTSYAGKFDTSTWDWEFVPSIIESYETELGESIRYKPQEVACDVPAIILEVRAQPKFQYRRDGD